MQAAYGFPSPAEDFFREDDRLDLNEKLIANPPAAFIVQADCGGSYSSFGLLSARVSVLRGLPNISFKADGFAAAELRR
jgi:hypothetical protein